MTLKHLKPHLNTFIQFYYNCLGHMTGYSLHIALDDGNLDKEDIDFCHEAAIDNKDEFGVFLALLMKEFTEEELEHLYSKDHWGMADQHHKREVYG